MSDVMKFSVFKTDIQRCFQKLDNITLSLTEILTSCSQNTFLTGKLKKEFKDELDKIRKSLTPHIDKIKREKMKCVFFGLTSNGKSAVINAILGKKVLPSSDGRTTSCFITIEGCDEKKGYFMINDKKENDISKLIEKANEISKNCLQIQSHIELFWPNDICHLLKEKVQLLDSPGVDYSKENDKWIDTYCLDSDVFVYVVNAQATINESERVFFRRVKELIKNPNIFVVMNKWDICDTKDKKDIIKEVREQHYKTVHEFLCEDLRINCNSREKVFFLSAKEQLDGGGDSNADKVKERREEFDRFYKKLCEEMSVNAIINKFDPPLDSGLQYMETIMSMLQQLGAMKKGRTSVTKINKEEIIYKINKYLKDVFIDMRKEGNEEIDGRCFELVNVIMNDKEDISFWAPRISEVIHEKIIKSLSDILERNIAKLATKLKELLASYSQFELSDDALLAYLPQSFTEHVATLEKSLANKLKIGDSKVRREYTSKENESEGVTARGFITTVGQVAANAAIPLLFKFPVASAIAFGASAIVEGANKMFPGQDKRREMKEYITDKTKEMLMKFMTDGYNQSEADIKETMEDLISKFSSNHDEARDIMDIIDVLKINSGEIFRNLLSSKEEIMKLV